MNGGETDLLTMAATQGPWAVLFVGLLFYVIREGARREGQLMAFLRAQGESLAKLAARVDRMCADLGDLKHAVKERLP